MKPATRQYDLSDAPEWAVQAAAQAKQLPVLEKAEMALRLQRDYGWPGEKIGALFGVTRSGVNFWYKIAADPERHQDADYREKNRYKLANDLRTWRERNLHGGARPTLWKLQDGRCYLCQRPMGPHLMAVIEHDHRCCPDGRSCDKCRRGLACGPCNRLIGFADDDPDRLELIARNLRAAMAVVTARL